MSHVCAHCGELFEEGRLVCPHCGADADLTYGGDPVDADFAGEDEGGGGSRGCALALALAAVSAAAGALLL